jgi:hypothetical protein
MSVASTNTERIDTDPFCPINGPLGGHYRNKQPAFLEGNCINVNTTGKIVIIPVYLLLGLGWLNLICGGIVRVSRDSTALIMLVMPDAPSECPKFALTYEG